MSNRNSCYTYFRIVGDFNPNEVTDLLNLTPGKMWSVGDLRSDGSKYDFASWEYGRCSEYNVEVEMQMRKTIEQLKDKVSLLNKIREKHDVSFVLEIVPSIYADDTVPSLAPSLDIIDFCYATRTQIDIDLYVCDSSDD